jgi:hypothetical protein
MKKYPISYDVTFDGAGRTRDELKALNRGGADALVIASILRGNDTREPHEGSKSIGILTADGRNGGEIPTTELFQVWSHISAHLMDAKDLSPWQREIAKDAFFRVRQKMAEVAAGNTRLEFSTIRGKVDIE